MLPNLWDLFPTRHPSVILGMSNNDLPAPAEKVTDVLQEDMKMLLASGTPTLGNYRDTFYSALIHRALDIIHQKVLVGRENDRHLVAYASCCQAWGEKRRLERMGHHEKYITALGSKQQLKISSKYELLKHLIGVEPYNQNDPWIVQFPRLAVQCGVPNPRPYTLIVAVFSIYQAQGYQRRTPSSSSLKALSSSCTAARHAR